MFEKLKISKDVEAFLGAHQDFSLELAAALANRLLPDLDAKTLSELPENEEIMDLLAQLIRMKAHGGYLTIQFQAPAPPDSRQAIRIKHAKKRFDRGFGSALGSFDAYLVTIPEVPEALLAPDAEFPHLVLVDPRPGVTETCKLLGIDYSGDDETFEDFDAKKSRPMTPYWIRAQDGARNRGKSVRACRKAFAERETGLTVLEGLALFAQNPKPLKGFAWDLPGSVHRSSRGHVASLFWFFERPYLDWHGEGCGNSKYGSGSRRE